MPAITDNLAAVHQNIADAAGRAGRRPEDITLIAVSKTHPPESVREALDAGQVLFGESRVQEARAKAALLPDRIRWHHIGHLQKNKVRAALPLFDLLHGIDSLELARELQRIATADGLRPAVLLEVNVAGESTKFGFDPDSLPGQMEELLTLDRLDLQGLMGMAPFDPDPERARPSFRHLRELRDTLTRDFGAGLPTLSMGMSGDYAVAIEEGATMVRVGSAIFGERPKAEA